MLLSRQDKKHSKDRDNTIKMRPNQTLQRAFVGGTSHWWFTKCGCLSVDCWSVISVFILVTHSPQVGVGCWAEHQGKWPCILGGDGEWKPIRWFTAEIGGDISAKEPSKHSKTYSEIQSPGKLCEGKKKASTGKKFCKSLREEKKEAALSAELTHGQKKETLTNCSQEETLASETGTESCKRILKFVTQFR